MKLTVRPATIEDAAALAGRLREWDRAELAAAQHETGIDDLLRRQVTDSAECLALCRDGQCIGLAAVKPVTDTLAQVGFLGAAQVEACPLAFFRLAKRQIALWQSRFGCLCNGVAERNTPCVRWLRAMGAQFCGRFELSGEGFLAFHLGGKA